MQGLHPGRPAGMTTWQKAAAAMSWKLPLSSPIQQMARAPILPSDFLPSVR